MASKRPTVFKTTTRAASGGAVLVGVALVLLFFRGKGIGIGVDSEGQTDPSAETSEGEQRASQTTTPEFASISNPLNSPETAQPAAEGKQQPELTIDEQVAVGQKTLGILIDERSYLLKIPGTPQDIFRPSTLDRVVQLAKMVSGDVNGIRVVILRRETARVTAEQNLKAALVEAGISANAVYMPNHFTP